MRLDARLITRPVPRVALEPREDETEAEYAERLERARDAAVNAALDRWRDEA